MSSFSIAAVDRIVAKNNVAATFTFSTSITGQLAIGSTITLNYPDNFFATSPTPTGAVSGGASLSIGAPGTSSIVMTTAGASFSASTAVTVTLSGFTLQSSPTAGGNVNVQTSADIVTSNSVASGVIGDTVTNISFSIANGDRVVKKRNAAATFSFTPSVGGAGPAAITLNYPSGFFANTSTPSAALSTFGATLIPQAPNVNFIIMVTGGTALAASTAVTVTLRGLTMGSNVTTGGNVTVLTSIDQVASTPVPSGAILNPPVPTPTSTSAPFTTASPSPPTSASPPPTTTANPNDSQDSQNSGALAPGAVAGISIGIIVAVAIAVSSFVFRGRIKVAWLACMRRSEGSRLQQRLVPLGEA